MRHDRETLCVEGGPTRGTISEDETYAAALERRAVADWIEGETGLVVPSRTDFVFRSALKDGVILCQLINAVQPPESDKKTLLADFWPLSVSSLVKECLQSRRRNSECHNICQKGNSFIVVEEHVTTKVIHIAQNDGGQENVTNIESFLGALTYWNFPAQHTFSVADLTAPLTEPHPIVASSLLKFKEHVSGSQRKPLTAKQPPVAEGLQLEGDFSTKEPSMGFTKMMEYWTTLLRQRILARGTGSEAGAHPEGVPVEFLDRFSGMLDSIMTRMEAESCTAVVQEREQRIARLEATLEDLKSRSGSGASTSRTSRTSRTEGDGNKENRGGKEMETLWREIQSEREAGAALERRLHQEKRLRGLLEDEIGVVRQGLSQLSEYVDKARPIEEENRKLYNTMLTLKGKLRVVCRLIGDAKGDAGVFLSGQGEIGVASGEGRRKLYKLDSVLPPGAGDIRAFEESKPLVRSVMDGFSACVVSCSGVNCNGKGSMLGDNGIVKNTLREALGIQARRQGEATYRISVRMAWVSKGNTFDLLAKGEVQPRQHADTPSTSIQSFSSEELVSLQEVEEVVNTGMQNSNSLSGGDLMVTMSVRGVCLGASEEFCSFFHMINLPAIETETRWFKREALLSMESLLCGIALGGTRPNLFRGHALGELLEGSCPEDIKGLLVVHVGVGDEDRSDLVEALKFASRVAQSREPKDSEGAKIMEMEGTLTDLEKQCVSKDGEISRLCREAEEFRMEKDKTAADTSAIRKEIEQLKAQLRRSRRQGSQSDIEEDIMGSNEPKELFLQTPLSSPNSSSSPSARDPCSSPHSLVSAESPTRIPRKQAFGGSKRMVNKSCSASKLGPGLSKLAKSREPFGKGTCHLEGKLQGSLASKKERYKKSTAVEK